MLFVNICLTVVWDDRASSFHSPLYTLLVTNDTWRKGSVCRGSPETSKRDLAILDSYPFLMVYAEWYDLPVVSSFAKAVAIATSRRLLLVLANWCDF